MPRQKRQPTDKPTASPTRWAIYARTSSDEQAQDQTITIQVDHLRQFAALNGLEIVGEYLDDGVSGTLPMDRRPAGSDMLRAARDGRFAGVLFYRVSRLGRRLNVVLKAHETLDEIGVALRSATEPIDTTTPIGRFVFQMLGAFSELDRESILDQMASGKLRNARDFGAWFGTAPLGYTVVDRRLAPCTDEIAPGLRECDLVRDIIQRIANGSSVHKEADRLTALGIAPFVRHVARDGTVTIRTEFKPRRGGEKRPASEWSVQRISRLVRSPIYKGTHTFVNRKGEASVPVPALVDAATWERANNQVEANRWREHTGTKAHYALTGKVVCANCGTKYTGHHIKRYDGTKVANRYYRCPGYTTSVVDGQTVRTRCPGKAIGADALEDFVWKWAKEILNTSPDDLIAEVRDRVFERDLSDDTSRRRDLIARVAELDGDRRRVLDMAQRGMMEMDEAQERTMALIQQRAAILAELDALANAQELAQAYEMQLDEVRAMIAQGTAYLDDNDPHVREMRLRTMLSAVVVKTERTAPRKSEAIITAIYGPKARPIGAIKRRDVEVLLEIGPDGSAVERQSSR